MSFNWIEKHSTNCKHCNHLVDERECVPEDDGDVCQDCEMPKVGDLWDWENNVCGAYRYRDI